MGFQDDRHDGALDTFDFHDFLSQDGAELFNARCGNYGDYVKFAPDLVDLVDAFEFGEGVYDLRFLRLIDKKVN